MNLECAHEIAIKYIGISKKSEFEVRLKLNRYGFSNLIVDQTIDFLKSIGYIDDAMYVDAYIIQCMHLLNYSIYEIKNKLLQKGINKNIIEDKIKKISSTDYECLIVEKFKKTKFKSMPSVKQKQYLYKRGFKI